MLSLSKTHELTPGHIEFLFPSFRSNSYKRLDALTLEIGSIGKEGSMSGSLGLPTSFVSHYSPFLNSVSTFLRFPSLHRRDL